MKINYFSWKKKSTKFVIARLIEVNLSIDCEFILITLLYFTVWKKQVLHLLALPNTLLEKHLHYN